ncbi:MAG: beta-N-acetylhexosaminidase, partial [bacterium]
AWGVDFSFAPVLDLDIGVSEVIGDRAFSDDPQVIAALGYAWRHGGHEAGMASVGKHFPGHGAVAADSHVDLPIDHRTYDEIWAQDVLPFKHLINNGLEAIMPAHVIYEACDAQPAGFSQFWIKQVLRERLGFNGVVFSDDLSMKAADVAGGYADRAHIALEAGCDMVLVCNCPEGAIETIESLESYNDPVAQTRLVRMHGKGHYTIDEVRENPRWHRTLDLIENLMGDHELSMEF